MRTYGDYKEAGIGWLTDIPVHWQVKPLYTIFKKNQQKNTALSESNVLSLSYGNIVRRDLSDNFGLIPESFNTYQIVKPGFIILRLTDLQNDKRSLRVGLVKDNGIITSAYIGLVGTEQIDSTYFYFQLHAYDLLKVFYNYGSGVRQTMSFEDLRRLPLIIPSYEEQVRIAYYLTNKIIQIDKLISDKEKLIELLNEERTAIINQAVTKGIDPDARMKDSGVDWLGEVPQHWQVKRMKYLCDIGTGDKDTENREVDGLYPFYVRSQTVERISTYSFNGEAILTAGDGVGVCKVWHYVDGKFDYHQRVYRMSDFKEVTGKYLFYYLKYNFEKEVKKLSAKSTVDSLRRPMFQNFLVSFGSITEQASIVSYIEAEEKRIEDIIAKTEQEIELLKEYKTALISEVVTGKVDVRNKIIPEIENLTLAS